MIRPAAAPEPVRRELPAPAFRRSAFYSVRNSSGLPGAAGSMIEAPSTET
jgi:hypothetical protein